MAENVGSDVEEQMGETVCICGKVFEEDYPYLMIQCDICRDWLHGECVQVDELSASDIEKYHCPRCEPMCGPSIMKVETNWHRLDKSDPDASFKPLQVGTKQFIEELGRRFFSPSEDIVMEVSGRELTLPYLNQSGFNQPILVKDRDGLSLSVPQNEFSVNTVASSLGEERMVDIIDVYRQQSCQMSLGQFAQHFSNPYNDRVLNCLSLEVSDTPLSEVFTPPLVARKLCWVNNVWPSSNLDIPKPQVQKYCIMSMKDSFTDFHIDFGGTSVWYHVYQGEKYFYLVRPTPTNLSLYERWTRLSSRSETFLGDMVDRCYQVKVEAGQTVFIPTGWIHAVYTPKTSIVFGGNFLHSLNIQLQLRIHQLENRLKDPPKFRFPSFEIVHWLAASKLKNDLADLNSDNTPCPSNLLNGIRALATTLKAWLSDGDNVPEQRMIDCPMILKDLTKELRNAERISLKVNPPKPERESNRRRKKKALDDDFIDITSASSLYLIDHNSSRRSKQSKKSGKTAAANKKPVQSHPQLVAVKSLPVEFQAAYANSPAVTELPALTAVKQQKRKSPAVAGSGVAKKPRHADKPPGNGGDVYMDAADFTGSIKLNLVQQQSIQTGELIEGIPMTGVSEAMNNGIPSASAATKRGVTANNVARGVDLTDRDSVRQLLVTQKQRGGGRAPTQPSELDSALSDAMIDFGGGDEAGLIIDEQPKGKNRKSGSGSTAARRASPIKPLKLRVSMSGQPEVTTANRVLASHHEKKSLTVVLDPKTKLHPKMAVKASYKKKISTNKRYLEENITKVHQDDEYIYPSLDLSDDEDLVKPGGRRSRGGANRIGSSHNSKDGDEAWNPKVRVSGVRREPRPVRASAKNVAIEKGLKKAAESRRNPVKGGRNKASLIPTNESMGSPPATPSTSSVASPSPSVGTPSSSTPSSARGGATPSSASTTPRTGSLLIGAGGIKFGGQRLPPELVVRVQERSRARKTPATAKQRLGKILGLKF